MNVSPNILAKNWNFKNLRNSFVDEKALIPTTLMSSCHWKTLIPFWLWKKRPENAFLTLIVNYRKIIQKNKLRLKTTINWLFNDISCYLFIACFDWKINVFQQTVIRVYYILKCCCVIFLMVDPRPIYSAMENKMIRGFSYWAFHIVFYVSCLCVGKGRHINITFLNCLDIFYEIFIYFLNVNTVFRSFCWWCTFWG